MTNDYEQAIACVLGGKNFTAKKTTNNLIALRQTASTMNWITRAIRVGRHDGLTVIALKQTAGRGSSGRKWESGEGNLMLSRALSIRANEFGQEMELIAACTVGEIIQDLNAELDVTIKFPNDVQIDGKKVAGFLVPPVYDAKTVCGETRLINLGVGVNLSVAPETAQRTTCLAEHDIAVSIATFVTLFDVKFADILMGYRFENDFNYVLNRMGFLNNDGHMTLRENGSGKRVTDRYNGFCVISDQVYIRLGRHLCSVHGWSAKNIPARAAALPSKISLEVVVPNG